VTFTVSTGDSLADLANQINATSGFAAQIVDAGGAGAATDRRLEIRTTNGEDLISADVSVRAPAKKHIIFIKCAKALLAGESSIHCPSTFNLPAQLLRVK